MESIAEDWCSEMPVFGGREKALRSWAEAFDVRRSLLGDEGFGCGRNCVDPLRLLQRGDIRLRNFINPVGRWKAVKQALAHDGEYLARVLLHRRDRLGVAIIMLRQIFNKGAQLPRAVKVNVVLEVGHYHTGAGAAR